MRKQLSWLIGSVGAVALIAAGAACSRTNTAGASTASPSGFGPTLPATQTVTSTENTDRPRSDETDENAPTAMGGGPTAEGSGAMSEKDGEMDLAVKGAIEGKEVLPGDQPDEKE